MCHACCLAQPWRRKRREAQAGAVGLGSGNSEAVLLGEGEGGWNRQDDNTPMLLLLGCYLSYSRFGGASATCTHCMAFFLPHHALAHTPKHGSSHLFLYHTCSAAWHCILLPPATGDGREGQERGRRRGRKAQWRNRISVRIISSLSTACPWEKVRRKKTGQVVLSSLIISSCHLNHISERKESCSCSCCYLLPPSLSILLPLLSPHMHSYL